jgi:hypothetical protein
LLLRVNSESGHHHSAIEAVRGLADAGINVAFVIAQVLGRKFTAAIGFDDESAATNGGRIIKAAGKQAPGRAGGAKRGSRR